MKKLNFQNSVVYSLMKNRKTNIFIVTAVLLIIFLTGCNGFSSHGPNKSQIKNDLAQENQVIETIDNTGAFNVKDVEIVLANTEEDIYTADIVVALENQVYSLQREFSIKYKHYDVGGWILENISGGNSNNIKVIGAYPESTATKNARYWNNDVQISNLKLESHKTDLSNKQDVFIFSGTQTGKYFDYTITFQETYSSENGRWKNTGRKILNHDTTLHPIDGLFYFGTSENGKAMHFNNDSSVTILYENEQPSKVTETPHFYFDTTTFTYKFSIGGYSFVITQDEIKFDRDNGKTLDKICFFERKWLREEFYSLCVSFLEEERNRSTSDYSFDPSSTIKQEDLYGTWHYQGVFRDSFRISPTGVDCSRNVITGSTKQNLEDIVMPKIDYLFYGYNAERQAYIVYFCTRSYTTSSFYVDAVHTMEFVKTSDGAIVLQRCSHDW